MHVAVTGGAGQLGTLVLRRLLADRSIKRVTCLDVRPPVVAGTKLRAVLADVRDRAFEQHLAGCDALVHLAFLVAAAPPRAVFDGVNVGGTTNVVEAAARASVRKIVYASSIAAYGIDVGLPVPLVEETPRRRVDDFPYSAAKYEVERFLDAFEAEHPEIAIVRFRPGILLGRYMENPLGAALRRGRMFAVSDAPLPVVWDEDAADAFHLALKSDVRGAFNLVTDDAPTPFELARAGGLRLLRVPMGLALRGVDLARALARIGIGEPVDPGWIRHGGHTVVASNEKARRVLGWSPKARTGVEVMRRLRESLPGRIDPRIALFFRVASLAARVRRAPAEAVRTEARVHVALTGRGGGDFAIAVESGRIAIAAGRPRPPTSVVTLKATTFLELLSGQSDYSAAQLTGKVRIEGEPMGGLILGGLVRFFREAQSAKGARGVATRSLAAWFAR